MVQNQSAGAPSSARWVAGWVPLLLSTFVALPVVIADPGSGCSFGADVASHDPVLGSTTVPIPLNRVAFIDGDGDAAYDSGETLFLDLDQSDKVSPVDVVLSGADAGSRPTVGSPPHNTVLTAFPSPALSFLDSDGDGSRDAGEAILLERSPAGTLGVGDHYLAPVSRAGQPHTSSDAGTGTPLASLSGSFAFLDADADGAADADERVIVDSDGNEAIGSADVCMTAVEDVAPPPGACTFGGQVHASHAAMGSPLATLSLSTVRFLDGDGDGAFDGGDPLYLDLDVSRTVSGADVRLSGTSAGTRPGQGDGDYLVPLLDFPNGALSYLDADSDQTRDAEESILLERAPSGTLGPGDHYLAPSSRAGNPHAAGDPGTGASLTPLAGSLAVVDRDHDGFGDGDEPVFVDVEGNAVLGGADVCLGEEGSQTSGPREPCVLGRTIRETDHAWGRTSIPISNERVAYLDWDGDASFDDAEPVLLDVDASGTVTIGDVRWSPGPGSVPAGARVASTDADINSALSDLASHRLGFVDANGDLHHDATEYFVLDENHVLGHGDRYLAPEGRAGRMQAAVAAGSTIIVLDSNAGIAFVDDDGDQTPDATEDIVGVLGTAGMVSTSDLCLSGANPGSLQGPVGPLDDVLGPAGSAPGSTGGGSALFGLDAAWSSVVESEAAEFAARHQAAIVWSTAGLALALLGWRLRVPARLLLLFPLYSKLDRDSVLKNATRRSILTLVEAQPGIHYQQIVRSLGRGHGVVDYHLRRLVQGKLVRAHRAAGRVHYFLPRDATPARLARLTSGPAAQRVLERVVDGPPQSSAALAAQLGLARSTVHGHVSRLTEAGLVVRAREGRQIYFRAATPGPGPAPGAPIPRIPPRDPDAAA